MATDLNLNEVAILTDISLCMSIYLMSRVCSSDDVDKFYEEFKGRIISQGFNWEDIRHVVEKTKVAMSGLKDEIH